MRKRSLLSVLLALSLCIPAAAVAADPYPSRPIRIVVNSAPGGWLDITARMVAQGMTKKLGQPFIVENRAGGDGRIGINAVKTAPADGYTLLAAASTIALLPAVTRSPGYDLERDFTGIGPMARAPFLMVTASSSSVRTLPEFITRAKANLGKATYATPGAGTLAHLASASLLRQADAVALAVPYKGAGAALPDVMAGRVDFILAASGATIAAVRDGRLRALGITSHQRMASAPDIPTVAEQGLPGFSAYQYLGLLAPAGVPEGVVRQLSEALKAALSDESIASRFRTDAAEAWASTPAEFTEFLQQDARRFVRQVESIGLAKE